MMKIEPITWDTPYIFELEDADEREAIKTKAIDDYLDEYDHKGAVLDKCRRCVTECGNDGVLSKSDIRGAVAMSIMTDKLIRELRAQLDGQVNINDNNLFDDKLLNTLRIVDQENIFSMVRNGTEVLNILSTILGYSMAESVIPADDAGRFVSEVFPQFKENQPLLSHITNTMIEQQELIDRRRFGSCDVERFYVESFQHYLAYMSV